MLRRGIRLERMMKRLESLEIDCSQAYTAPQKGPNRLASSQWDSLLGVLNWAAPTPERLRLKFLDQVGGSGSCWLRYGC